MIYSAEVLEEALRRLPDNFVYCANRGRWISGEEFLTDVQVFRRTCQSLRKDLVLLMLENSYEFLVSYVSFLLEEFPILLSGKKTWDEVNPILSAYSPGYVLIKDGIDKAGSAYASMETPWEGVLLYNAKVPSQIDVAGGTSLLLGTSGSTGSPKFVRLSLHNIISNAQSIVQSLDIMPTDRAITCLPTSYSFGLSIINSYILAGGSLVLWDKGIMDPEFWTLMREQKVTSFSGVPYSYQMVRRLGFEKMELPDLRVLTQAGGKLTPPLVREFADISKNKNLKFYIMYGQTEASARMTYLPAEMLEQKIGSVGKAIPGGDLSVVDMDPETGHGEIMYSGPNVMLGYAEERSDLLKENEQKGVLRTGDLGYLDPDGYLFITGRKKRIAKVTGLRISLDEVESLVANLGAVAAVSSDEKIIIYHSSIDEKSISSQHDELVRMMKLHKSLVQFRFVTELPTSSNGKTDYQALMRLL